MKLDQLVEEVFLREERGQAELRLSPRDAEQLSRSYPIRCTPVANGGCADGKGWYLVRLEGDVIFSPPAPHTN